MLGRLLSSVGKRAPGSGAAPAVEVQCLAATPDASPPPPLSAPSMPPLPSPATSAAAPALPALTREEHARRMVLEDQYYRLRHLELLTLQMQFAGMQLIETLLAQPALADPKRLERHGAKTFSQNDEDGIIAEIFRRIGAPHRTFVEFGCGDGLENNTACLLAQGWRGLWMDGGGDNTAGIRRAYDHLIGHGLLKFRNVFINRDNIDGLIGEAGLGQEIDLLSIDLDGNDYYIWEAIRTASARVVTVEYNGKFIPPHDWCMAYDAEHIWDGTDLMGSSLAALARLGESKGYQLVGCNITGSNAFFVRRDLAAGKFAEPATAAHLFQPARYDLSRCYMVGHAANSLTVLQGACAAAELPLPPAAAVDSITHVILP